MKDMRVWQGFVFFIKWHCLQTNIPVTIMSNFILDKCRMAYEMMSSALYSV